MLIPSLLYFYFTTAFGYDGDEIDSQYGCPAVFKGRCHCSEGRYSYWRTDEDLYIVNCTNAGFSSTEMLELLPRNTQVLIFTGNKLQDLDWNIFGVWDNHEALEVVDLSNNRIEDIPGKTFHKVKNVKKLILNHNNLRISGPNSHPRLFTNFYNLEELHLVNAFSETIDSGYYLMDLKDIFVTSNMTKLRKIRLDQNEIWKIKDEDMFCDLPSLTELYLGDNQLQTIDFSLDCLEKLNYLDLEYNKIRRLDEKTLKKLDKAFGKKYNPDHRRRINLKENPFYCDCHFRPFYDWITDTDAAIVHKEDLRCYEGWPKGNAGKRIENIQELECPPKPSSSSQKIGVGTSITHALLLVLILMVSALLAVLILVNRTLIKNRFSPLFNNLQKSMQYKTIRKEDEIISSEANV